MKKLEFNRLLESYGNYNDYYKEDINSKNLPQDLTLSEELIAIRWRKGEFANDFKTEQLYIVDKQLQKVTKFIDKLSRVIYFKNYMVLYFDSNPNYNFSNYSNPDNYYSGGKVYDYFLEEVSKSKRKEILISDTHKENLAFFKGDNNKWGIFNFKTDETIVEPKFDKFFEFDKKSFAICKINNVDYSINKEYEIKSDINKHSGFSNSHDLKDGNMILYFWKNRNDYSYIIDKNGNMKTKEYRHIFPPISSMFGIIPFSEKDIDLIGFMSRKFEVLTISCYSQYSVYLNKETKERIIIAFSQKLKEVHFLKVNKDNLDCISAIDSIEEYHLLKNNTVMVKKKNMWAFCNIQGTLFTEFVFPNKLDICE